MRNRFQRSSYMTVRNDTVVTSFNKRPSDDLVFSDVCNKEKFKNVTASDGLSFSDSEDTTLIPAPVIRTFSVGRQTIVMSETHTYQTGRLYVNETM